MPLNASERTDLARAFLTCFGEDAQPMGKIMKFMSQFTTGQVNLLVDVQNAATTWQPFIDSGLSIEAWKTELARYFNATQI
jgi:hypothetical protein